MGDILSQKEIDDLINSFNAGEIDVKQELSQEKKVRVHNFKNPNKFAKDHLTTLRFIYENYARIITSFLSGYLRTGIQVELTSVQELSYFEFTNSLPDPVVLAIADFSPLKGSIIYEMAPNIVFAIIDRILGGKCEMIEKVRNFTDIEIAILDRVLNQLLDKMREPWETIMPLRLRMEKIGTNAQFIQFINYNEMVAIVTLNAKINDVEGMINICIPYMLLEPILPKLNTRLWFSSVEKETTDESKSAIEKKIQDTQIPVRAILGYSTITVRDFLEIQVGDVITLDNDVNGDIDILVGDILKFHAKPGVRKSRLSFKITQVVRKEEEEYG